MVKQAASRRKQFLPYFTGGTPIGECILAEPGPHFVRARVDGDKALIVVLNDRNSAVAAELKLNLALWLTEGAYQVSRYDADGRLGAAGGLTVAKERTEILKVRKLNPGEMEFITIERRAARP